MKLKFENPEIAHIEPMSLSNIPRMKHLRLTPVIRSICDPIVHFPFRDYSIIICYIKNKRLVRLNLGQSYQECRSNLSVLFRMKS